MSWYRLVFILSALFSFSITASSAKKLVKLNEDQLIFKALLYEEYHAYENSYQVYRSLYENTGEEIYLFKEATAALMCNKHIVESILRLKTWEKVNPKRVEAKRLLIPLYLTNKEIQNATKEAECLVENSKEPIDLDMAAKPFLFAGNFKRALELLTQLYEAVPNEEVLFKIVQIMDEFTGERKKAIQLLETYRRMNHASTELHTMLLVLYQKERNVDGILQTYKALYKENKDEAYLSKIIDAYMYKRDLEGAIDFLEQDQTREDFLYELYKAKKDFDKALLLVDKLYAADQNAKWLAEKAVLIFEKAQDKNDKKMIQDVLDYFEKAIALGNDDSIYLNYYGYTLIDKEVDIKKGMNVIQNALVQQPENIYYLDSLAWGYYKQHQCDEAYKLMKKIVDEDGLNEKEIVDHWDAIRQCK
ncbi:MAG: hypothetical protein RL113_337 [Pseudomonadota bacterium]